MRINKSNCLYSAIGYIFVTLACYLLVSQHFSDNYLSPFYTLPAGRSDPYEHTQRLLSETGDWLAERKGNGSIFTETEEVAEDFRKRGICVVTPAKKRQGGIDYLSTSLGSLNRDLNGTSRSDLSIIAFFPDGETDYAEAKREGKLDNGLIDLATYMGDPRTTTRRTAWLQDEFDMCEGRGNWLPDIIHLLYGLELCLSQTEAEWVLWLEDDVIARPDWYEIVKEEVIPSTGRREEKTLFTMLFWSESRMFWANEDIPIVVAYYILPGVFLLIAVCFIQIYDPFHHANPYTKLATSSPGLSSSPLSSSPHPSPSWNHRLLFNLTYGTLLYLLLTPYITLFIYTGKLISHSPLPHNGLSPQLAGACCSQALLFSREGAEGVMDPVGEVIKTGTYQMFDRKGPDALLFDLGSAPPHRSDWLGFWRWRSPKIWSTTDTEFLLPAEAAALGAGTEKVDLRGKFGRGTMWLPGLFQHIGDVSEYKNAEIKGRLKSWSFEVGMREMMGRKGSGSG